MNKMDKRLLTAFAAWIVLYFAVGQASSLAADGQAGLPVLQKNFEENPAIETATALATEFIAGKKIEEGLEYFTSPPAPSPRRAFWRDCYAPIKSGLAMTEKTKIN